LGVEAFVMAVPKIAPLETSRIFERKGNPPGATAPNGSATSHPPVEFFAAQTHQASSNLNRASGSTPKPTRGSVRTDARQRENRTRGSVRTDARLMKRQTQKVKTLSRKRERVRVGKDLRRLGTCSQQASPAA
jgi:hypothetical protein